ncbi:protein kinase [Orobanche hederae]
MAAFFTARSTRKRRNLNKQLPYLVGNIVEFGQGGFAQVFIAYLNSNPNDVVALKIQNPPFPWEFYMYRQLDMRIPENERKSFGFAHRLYLYSDYSDGKEEDKNTCR